MEETRPEERKAKTIHLWVNTASVVVSAMIPVVWDIVNGIAN